MKTKKPNGKESKRIPISKTTPKQSRRTNRKESGNTERDAEQQEKLNEMVNDQLIEIIQLKFDNDLLLTKMERPGDQQNQQQQKKSAPNVKDVDLFFNTKQHYVDVLHRKLKEQNQALQVFNYNDVKEETLRQKMKVIDIKTSYKTLARKYVNVKNDKRTLLTYKKNYKKVLPKAKKMRKILKNYFENGAIDDAKVTELYLDVKDELLDEDAGDDAEQTARAGEENIDEVDPDELKSFYLRGKKMIRDLQEEIDDLNEKLTRERLEFKDRTDEYLMFKDGGLDKMAEGHEDAMEKLREEFENEIEELKGNNKELEDRIFKESNGFEEKHRGLTTELLELKKTVAARTAEVDRRVEEGKVLKEKVKKLEAKGDGLAKERNDLLHKSIFNKIQNPSKANLLLQKKIEEAGGPASLDLSETDVDVIKEDLETFDKLREEFENRGRKLSELEKRLAKIEGSNDELRMSAIGMKAEMESGVNQHHLLDSAKDVLNQSNVIMDNEIGLLRKKMGELQKQVDISAKESSKNKREIDDLMATNNDLTDKNQYKDDMIKELSKLKDDLEKKIEGLGDKKSDEIEILKKREAGLKEDFARDLNEKVEEIEKLEGELSDAEFANAMLTETLDAKEKNLAIAIAEGVTQRKKIKIVKEKIENNKKEFKKKLDEINNGATISKETYYKLEGDFNYQKKEIEHLRYEAILKNREIKIKDTEIVKLQSKLDEFKEENKTALNELNELRKFKIILQEMKDGQGDYVTLKESNLEHQETIVQLRSVNKIVDKENSVLKKKYLEYYEIIAGKDKRIEEMVRQNRDLSLNAYVAEGLGRMHNEKLATQAQQIVDFTKETTYLKGENKRLTDDLDSFAERIANDKFLPASHQVLIRIAEKEKERISERNRDLEVQFVKLTETINQKEKRIVVLQEERTELMKKVDGSNEDDLRKLLLERNRQLMDIVRDSNYKSEVINSLTSESKRFKKTRIEFETKIKTRDARLEEFLQKEIKAKKVERATVKVDLTTVNSEDPQVKALVKKIESQKDEITFLRSHMKDGDISMEDNPLIKKYKSELEEVNNNLKNKEEMIEKNNEHLAERLAEIGKLENDVERLEDKVDLMNEANAKAQIRIAELRFIGAKTEETKNNAGAEFKRFVEIIEERETELKKVKEELADMQMDVERTEGDKVLLKNQIDRLREEIRFKEEEIAAGKKENDELHENLIKNTEHFITKIQEEEARSASVSQQIIHSQDEIRGLRRKNEKLEEISKNLKSEKKDLETECLSAKRAVEEFKEKTGLDNAALDKLVKERGLNAKIRDKEELVGELQDKIDRLEKEQQTLEDYKNRINLYDPSKFETNIDYSEGNYRDKLNRLKKQVGLLTLENSKLKARVDSLEVGPAESAEFKYKDFFTNIGGGNIANKMDSADLKRQVESLESALNNGRQDYVLLKKENTGLNKTVKADKREIEDLKFELESVNQKLFEKEKMREVAEIVKSGVELEDRNKKVMKMLQDRDEYYKELISLKDEEIKKLNKLRKDEDEKHDEIRKLRRRVLELERDVEFAQKKVDVAKRHSINLEAFIKENENSEGTKDEDKKDLVQRINQLKSEDKENKLEIEKLTDEVAGKEIFIKDLETDCDEKNKKIDNLREKIVRLETTIRDGGMSNHEAAELVALKDDEIERYKALLEDQKETETEINENQDEIAKKEVEIRILNKKLEESMSTLEKQNKVIGDLTESNNRLKEQLKSLLTNIEEISLENEKLKAGLNKEVQMLTNLTAQKSQSRIDRPATNQPELQKENTELRQANKSLREANEQQKGALSDLKQENEFLKEENEKLKDDMTQVLEDFSQIERQVQEANNTDDTEKVKKLIEEKNNLEEENEKLKNKIKAMNDEISVFEKKNGEKDDQVKVDNVKLREKIKLLQLDIEKHESQNADQEIQIRELEEEINDITNTIQPKIEEMVDKIEDLTVENERLTDENEKLKNKK